MNLRLLGIRLSLLLSCSFFYGHIYAAVFTVTSNADSGAGTLREALILAAANGNVEVDFIRFNLPGSSPEDHTIKVLSNFPEISSDVVIDASTQPGANAAINGAKVIIDGTDWEYSSTIMQIVFEINSVNRFELYGIVIRNFVRTFSGTSSSIISIQFSGLNKNVVIGAPGKGNVLYNIHGIVVNSYTDTPKHQIQNLTLKSNFLGVKENGVDIAPDILTGLNLLRVYNLNIGGITPAEGNIIYGMTQFGLAKPGEQVTENASALLRNNIFTANLNEDRPGVTVARNSIHHQFTADANLNHTGSVHIEVTDNVFGAELSFGGLDNSDILVNRNFFGTSRNRTTTLPIQSQAISFYHTTGRALVGGTSITEGNIITNTSAFPVYPKDQFALISEDGNNVELSHNSFYCNPGIPYLLSYTGPFNKPIEVFLKEKTPTYVAGTTKPGSRVELYYTDPECTNCQPKRYIVTVTADAQGNWRYNGTIEAGFSVLASATLNQLSSEFSDPRIYMIPYIGNDPHFKVTNQTCEEKKGKIEGAFTVNADKIEWLDEQDNIVGNTPDVENLPAGKYRIRANQFGCIVYSDWVIVENNIPQLAFGAQPNIIHASCGNGGSILNLYPNYYTELSWLDKNGIEVGNQRELIDVPPGEYRLRLKGLEGSGCIKEFGPYIIINVNGPNIDDTGMKKTNATCLVPSGSIKNLNVTGTGTIIYTWLDANGSEVGHNKDIDQLPEGSYKLRVKDESSCGAIESAVFTIETDDKIELNDQNAIPTKTACGASTGTIKGITFTGTGQFKWLNERNETVGTSAELTAMPEGTYHLVFSNNLGCTKESRLFTIETAATTYPEYQIITSPANCDQFNGSINIDFGSGIKPDRIRITNETGQPAGNTTNTPNLKPGNYTIYFTIDGECEKLYKQVNVGLVPKLTIHTEAVSVIGDNCMLGNGSITGISVTGGTLPYTYTWLSDTGLTFSAPNPGNLHAGSYQLTVKDQNGCEAVAEAINITNSGSFITPPEADPITACPGTTVVIRIKNAHANTGVYNLYKGLDISPIASSLTGSFNVIIDPVSDYFISYKTGECESEKNPLKLTIGEPNIRISNTFSPNGDGINDTWQIQDLSKYAGAQVSIFNRNGQKIFSSAGYDKPFDGKWQGTDLATGTYYYVIHLKGSCSSLKGAVTIIR